MQPRYKHKLSCVTAMPSQESLHSYSPTSDAFPSKHALSEKHAPVIQHSLQAVKPEEQVLDAAPDLRKSFDDFVNRFPEYRKTWILDSLRRSDYTRLAQSGETYVDYMGGWSVAALLIKSRSFITHDKQLVSIQKASFRYIRICYQGISWGIHTP